MPIVFDSSRMPGDRIVRGAKSKTYTSLDRGAAPAGVDPAQWAANPYAQFDYRHTWWQKLWEGLGFRSKFDEYRDSMALNAAEYDAQLAEKAHNEEYDSPLAQAQRQREAGLNPDLNGNVDSGSSSPMEPDPNAPISPGFNDPMPIVEGFANTVMSTFTGAIGLANSVFGMIGNSLDNDLKRVSKYQGIVAQAIDYVHQRIPETYPSGGFESLAHSGYFDDMAEFASSAFNRRDAKLFQKAVGDYARSAPAEAKAYEEWYKAGKNRSDYATLRGSGLFSDVDEVLFDLIEPLSKAIDRVKFATLSEEAESSEYNADYFSKLDSGLAAGAVNTTNRRNLASGEIDAILNEAMNDIVRSLERHSKSNKKGSTFAKIALLAFQVLRMMSMSHTQGQTPFGPTNTTTFGF